MARTVEAKSWRRGFAGGFLALVLSVGGQAASSRWSPEVESCPLQARRGFAGQLIQHLKPTVRTHGVAQRVALAVLGAMLHSDCS